MIQLNIKSSTRETNGRCTNYSGTDLGFFFGGCTSEHERGLSAFTRPEQSAKRSAEGAKQGSGGAAPLAGVRGAEPPGKFLRI